jgi:hypothetical protein
MKTYKDKSIDIKREDLPGIYYSASEASQAAQKMFLLLIKINIGLLLIMAVLSAININSIQKENQYLIPLISAILMLLSIFITYATETGKFEKKWYDGRAIAESLKSLSWKFMMKAEPFYDLTKEEAESKFISDFREIQYAIKPSGELFGDNIHANEHQLTDKMLEIFASDLDSRKGTYENYRIGNQKKWYSKKTNENAALASRFFWIIIGLQIFTTI